MVDKYTTNKDINMNRQQAVEQARQASLKSWAQAQRQAMHESTRNTPVNQAPAAAAGASGTGSGGQSATTLSGVINWLEWAPSGYSGPTGQQFTDFDNWTVENTGISIPDVKRLVINTLGAPAATGDPSGPIAHVHEDHAYSDLTIELHDVATDNWITVWSYRLVNTHYGSSHNSDDFYIAGIDVSFPAITEVNGIRVSSDPGSDQTYHEWGVTGVDLIFELYK
jgi:hypothetical protein